MQLGAVVLAAAAIVTIAMRSVAPASSTVVLDVPGRADQTPWVAASGSCVAVAWGTKHRGMAAERTGGGHAAHQRGAEYDGVAMAGKSGLYYASVAASASNERELARHHLGGSVALPASRHCRFDGVCRRPVVGSSSPVRSRPSAFNTS
jgi:hypothetical protein